MELLGIDLGNLLQEVRNHNTNLKAARVSHAQVLEKLMVLETERNAAYNTVEQQARRRGSSDSEAHAAAVRTVAPLDKLIGMARRKSERKAVELRLLLDDKQFYLTAVSILEIEANTQIASLEND